MPLPFVQILGVVMLSIALNGYFKNEGMKKNTDILESLNLGVLTIIIIVAAAATVFTSFLGFMGAYFKNMLTLKLVSPTTTFDRNEQGTGTGMGMEIGQNGKQ